MTKSEYEAYVERVDAFFEREKLTNLTTGVDRCASCREFVTGEPCPCGETDRIPEEPFYSTLPCECCGNYEAGTREHASGFCTETESAAFFVVCQDCAYFCTYGALDDQTMMDIERGSNGS